ncbi:MAG: C-GCAxxG-C-C family protein [Bacteroidales bacterium]|nr:C-GCAxxG-C-C family protein [Bacteroidales bacterium]
MDSKAIMDKEERVRTARSLFKQGYNCCQAVVLAYSDLAGCDKELLAGLASGFGGGMGRMRQVCGCVSGMTLLCGMMSPACDPGKMDERRKNYALVQKLAGAFRNEAGSIICSELLSSSGVHPSTDASPSERTEHYYHKRPCEELVALAASIVADEISGHDQ